MGRIVGRVEGKVALISGASKGIGKASAMRLAEEGATVIMADVDEEAGETAAQEINSAGGKAAFMLLDVTSESNWQAVISQTLEKFNRLNVLVNNAGIALVSSIVSMSLEDFHRQNAINLDGVFLGLKHGIPAIADSGGGSIINLSSVAGLKAAPGTSAYSMTKGGVRYLSKSVALECINANNGVRVNSIHPGIIETNIWDNMGSGTVAENRERIARAAPRLVPGGKVGQPIDIANGVLFLASDESSYMTGSELVIDHGFAA